MPASFSNKNPIDEMTSKERYYLMVYFVCRALDDRDRYERPKVEYRPDVSGPKRRKPRIPLKEDDTFDL